MSWVSKALSKNVISEIPVIVVDKIIQKTKSKNRDKKRLPIYDRL